jgi:hypothetical protein
MNYAERILQQKKDKRRTPILDKNSPYQSIRVSKDPEWVFNHCLHDGVMDRIMTDLPDGVTDFFELSFIAHQRLGNNGFEIDWKSKDNLDNEAIFTLAIERERLGRGTILSVQGFSTNMKSKEETSDLILVFLKRLKSLLETGEIATTKGQPSGREELTLH